MIKLGSDEPAIPRTRIKRYTWTEEQIEILMRKASWYTNRGMRVRWRKIAALTGHHENSCSLKYHLLRKNAEAIEERARIDAENARLAKQIRTQVKPVPLPVRVIDAEHSRGGSFRLQVDAELRARIGEQGVTAGLLGDPPPGRSALDKMRSGIVDEPFIDSRAAQMSRYAPITLATEPMR